MGPCNVCRKKGGGDTQFTCFIDKCCDFFKDSAVNFIMVLSVIAIKSVLFHKYHNVNKLFLCVYLLPSFMFNSNLYKLYLYPLMFILLLGRINIYKVVISVCLSVCLSERGCSFISKGATIFCLDLLLHVFLWSVTETTYYVQLLYRQVKKLYLTNGSEYQCCLENN